MTTRTTTAVALGVFAALAATSHAVTVITTVGSGTGYDDTTPAFLSTDVAKTSDVDGDNAYGTAGRFMFGRSGGGSANGQPFSTHINVLPSWVTSATPGDNFNNVAYGYTYTVIDHPALPPGPGVANWASRSGIATATNGGSAGAWRSVVHFTIGAGTPQNFRLGVMAGNEHTDDGRWDPTGIRLTGPNSSMATVTSLPVVDPGLGWVFFDVDTGGATGGTFAIFEQQRTTPQGGSIGGFTFDVAADPIPEPITMLAVGMGVAGLGGYVRKRRRC